MTTSTWGYERSECRGDYALSLFLDDIDRVVTHYSGQGGQVEANLFRAQAAANKLLQAYDKNARGTQAFKNQSIQIKSVVDENNLLQFVPIFSSGLKESLIKLLKRSNQTQVH